MEGTGGSGTTKAYVVEMESETLASSEGHKIYTPADTVAQLSEDLRRQLKIEEDISLFYLDPEFGEYVVLDDIAQLPDLPKLRIAKRKQDASLEGVAHALRDPVNGVAVKTRMFRLKSYPKCFIGSEATDWVQNYLKVERSEAILVCKNLLQENFIHHITYDWPFEDRLLLYQFQDLGDTSRKASAPPNLDMDEVMLSMLNSKNGIVVKTRKDTWGFKKHKDSFVGSEAVDWLSTNLNLRRNVAVTIGQELLQKGFFSHVTNTLPFADAPFLYTTKGAKRPEYEFPAERIVRLLSKIKADDVFQGSTEDIDYVINALGVGAKTLFNVGVDELLRETKDAETKSLVLSHTGVASPPKAVEFTSKKTPRQESLMHLSDPISAMLEKVCDWNFDIFKFNELTEGHPLALMCYGIFRHHNLFDKFDIEIDKFNSFFSCIGEDYQSKNSYHNVIHATDVLQTTNYFLTKGGLGGLLSSNEILASLIAAAIHDVDHPGFNNAFLVNSRNPLALLYNDLSVLENHHCSHAFTVLTRSEEHNFLSHLPVDTWKEIRKYVVNTVLATDFEKHFDYVGLFKSTTAVLTCDTSKADVRELFIQTAVKCADISHAAKSLDLHLDWTSRISEEFYRQGDEEKRQGLNVSPLMDRITGNVAKSQIGFINFMVLPLYQAWANQFEDSNECLKQLESNLAYWKGEVEKVENPKPVAPQSDPGIKTRKKSKAEKTKSRKAQSYKG